MSSLKANLAVQEARLAVAMGDLEMAQAQLDEKERELALVQAEYDKAMAEKQVCNALKTFDIDLEKIYH